MTVRQIMIQSAGNFSHKVIFHHQNYLRTIQLSTLLGINVTREDTQRIYYHQKETRNLRWRVGGQWVDQAQHFRF